MSDRSLKTALIVSLLVNAFLAAAVVAGGIYLSATVAERAYLHQHTPLASVVRGLDPSIREQLRRSMPASAWAEFHEAHAARKDAVDHLTAQTVDLAVVEADLARARAAENRGRTEVEHGFVEFVKTQPQPMRAKLATVLLGRNSMRLHVPGPGGAPPCHDGVPPPPPASGPPPPGR